MNTIKKDTGDRPEVLKKLEDIKEIMNVAEAFATHTKNLENHLTHRTNEIEVHIDKLEKEIETLKSKS